MAKKNEEATALYQLKITLVDSMPSIWRKVLVKDNIKLDQLHLVLQVAMGWEDYHLHQYKVGKKFIGIPDPDFFMELIDESTISLKDIVSKPKDKFVYEYDFGDGWDHEVVLEEIRPLDFSESPRVVAGRMACPPEDCGGIGGYYRYLEIISDPDHEDHEMMIEWNGEGFDPEEFSLELVNDELEDLMSER